MGKFVKPMRLFLANLGRRQVFFKLAPPPMGLLYLAGYLRTKFDLDIRVTNQRESNCTNEELVQLAVDFHPDVVGLSALTPAAHAIPGIVEALRAALPGVLIVIGGAHVSAVGAQTLSNNTADAAVCGEGELVLEEILRAHLESRSFGEIPGLFWRDGDGQIISNPGVMPPIEDVDSLPFPAYDLLDVTAYWHQQSMAPLPNRKYLSLLTSRGCPYRCHWCHKVFGKKFRAHSPERVVDEIEHYVKTYGITDIEIIDDIFNFDPARVVAISELLLRRNIKVRIAFPNAIRADIVTEEVMDALVAGGTFFCSFALDSGSPRIQELFGKHQNIPRFLEGVRMAAARGVFTNGFAMLGFPTETEAEILQTIDTAVESMLHTISFFTVTPFPNTELYDHIARTAPEKLARIRYDDMNFSLIAVNFSAVPDAVLFKHQRRANHRFFGSPRRLCRILRDFPQPCLLPFYAPEFLSRATKGILGQRTGVC